VVEVQNAKVKNGVELLSYQQTHTEYVALSWVYDKAPAIWICGAVIKMNTEEDMAGAVEYVG
jgi:hypothetical protein